MKATDTTPASAVDTGTKEPDDPASADAPMTRAQAACLKMLAAQAREPEIFRARLTQAEAARRIGALKAKLVLMDGPPHTL